jgi:hypothetical protein
MILLLESMIVGLCSSIIGSIIYKLVVNKKITSLIIIAFFITGFAIHLVLETIGFNKIICNKKCMKTINLLNK